MILQRKTAFDVDRILQVYVLQSVKDDIEKIKGNVLAYELSGEEELARRSRILRERLENLLQKAEEKYGSLSTMRGELYG